MKDEYRKFFDLIAYSVCSKPLAEGFSCSEKEIKDWYYLSTAHDISSIIAYALEKNGLYLNDEFSLKFQDEMMFSAGRVALLGVFYDDVCRSLKNEKVDYVALKGAVIRKMYSNDFFRTSSDIDLLVKKDDFDRACRVLSRDLGLKGAYRSSHDLALVRSPFETVEIHYSLIEDERANNANELLKNAWTYATVKEDSEYVFTTGFFKFYHITHMLKHFEESGCGIRFFLDLYYLRELKDDEDFFRRALDKYGLTKFYDTCEKLLDYWLIGGDAEKTVLKMNAFVLSSGLYGSVNNYVAIGKKKSGGKLRYVFKRIFLPYDKLRLFFPKLEGKKWLTPFYQVKRWALVLFGGRLKSKITELKHAGVNDGSQADKIRDLFDELGIK